MEEQQERTCNTCRATPWTFPSYICNVNMWELADDGRSGKDSYTSGPGRRCTKIGLRFPTEATHNGRAQSQKAHVLINYSGALWIPRMRAFLEVLTSFIRET